MDIKPLAEYFSKEPSVLLAYLYGSFAKGIDISVYLKDAAQEDRIWREVTEILQKEVDLISLNDAPSTLISNVLKTGTPLVIKDRNLFWNLYLEKTLEAEDFAEFAEDYWRIYQRSQSLSAEDKTRFIERLQFLESEFVELGRFEKITEREFREEKPKRREMERWAENIMNATVDIAKIILASEKKAMPKTYEEILRDFGMLAGLNEEDAKQFSAFARLRNLLAHDRIKTFIKQFPELYKKSKPFLEKYAG